MPHNLNKNDNNDRRPLMGKDRVQVIAAAVFLVLIFVLLAYFTITAIPEKNASVIFILVGIVSGAAANAIPKLFGEPKDSEAEHLKERVEKLEKANEILITRNEILKNQLDTLSELLVNRHVLATNGKPHDDSFELNSRKDSLDE